MMKTYSDLELELSELRRRKNLLGMHDHSNVRLYHARRKYLNVKIDSLIRRLNPYTKNALKVSVDACRGALIEVLRDSGATGAIEMDGEKLYITSPFTDVSFTGMAIPFTDVSFTGKAIPIVGVPRNTIHCVAALGYPTTQTVASYKSTEISCMPVSYELEYETVKVLTVDGV